MQYIPKRLKTIVGMLKTAWGRTPVYWMWKKPATPMDTVFYNTSQLIHRSWKNFKPRYVVRLIYLYMLLVWPCRALLLILKNLKEYGSRVKRVVGVGYGKQLLDQFRLGLVKNVSPELYYKYELFTLERYSQAGLYITGNVASTLFAILNHFDTGHALEDKAKVDSILSHKGFPTVPLFAIVSKNGIHNSDGQEAGLPDEDFIAKPNLGKQGQGIYRFERTNSDNWNCSNAECYTNMQLLEFLRSLAAQGDYLIQKRMINHPELADLSGGGFCTIRAVTARRISGEIELIFAAFRMPAGKEIMDNYSAGGIAAPVNLQTGTLGSAVSKHPLTEILAHHPDTSGKILGRKLPHWRELMQMATDAHQCFPEYVFLGWDIGIDFNGPVIIETNVVWDVDIIQRSHMLPLGETRFVEIANEYLTDSMSEI